MFFRLTKEKANKKLQRAFANRDFADVIDEYRKLIAKSPYDHELFNNLGIAYMESGALSESIETFHNANRLLPTSIHFNNLGRALLEDAQYEAARIAFARGRELDPADSQPWYNTTVALRKENRHDEAHRELLEFLRKHSTHANGLNDLGCYHIDRGETEHAIQCFTQAVSNHPSAFPARLNLIRLLCDIKRHPDARPHLEALAKQGFNVRVHAENDIVSIDLNGTPFYRTNGSN